MSLSAQALQSERDRIANMVLDLVKARGAEVSYASAHAESGLTRARFEQIFADYDELFDAVAQIWLAEHLLHGHGLFEAAARDALSPSPPGRPVG